MNPKIGPEQTSDSGRCGFIARPGGSECATAADWHIVVPEDDLDPDQFWSLDLDRCVFLWSCHPHVDAVINAFPVKVGHLIRPACLDKGALWQDEGCITPEEQEATVAAEREAIVTRLAATIRVPEATP